MTLTTSTTLYNAPLKTTHLAPLSLWSEAVETAFFMNLLLGDHDDHDDGLAGS